MVPDLDDTIVAIGTAAGGAARGMIRISGPDTLAIVSNCFRLNEGSLQRVKSPHMLTGQLGLGDKLPSLPCDLFFWPGAQSYTRQPSAELHTLGSPPLLELAMATLCRHGARVAEPGEFTLRAFLAGRLDLMQAEAVLGVIDARSDESLQTALGQLAGGLSKPLSELREQLLQLLAHLEAGLDFVEEDIEFISKRETARQLAAAQARVGVVLAQLNMRGESRTLPKVVLAGPPNAGKSSLFNALAERFPKAAAPSRALVSEVAGTTRDYLSATVELKGIVCELLDTAGIEQAGFQSILGHAQQMTAGQLQQACCTVWCVDVTSATFSDQVADLARDGLVAATKADLRPDTSHFRFTNNTIVCSSYSGEGLDALAEGIAAALGQTDEAIAVASTSARCAFSLTRAQESLNSALTLVQSGGGDELIAAELQTTLEELGRVVGAVYTDDILDRIFSTFCIGK